MLWSGAEGIDQKLQSDHRGQCPQQLASHMVAQPPLASAPLGMLFPRVGRRFPLELAAFRAQGPVWVPLPARCRGAAGTFGPLRSGLSQGRADLCPARSTPQGEGAVPCLWPRHLAGAPQVDMEGVIPEDFKKSLSIGTELSRESRVSARHRPPPSRSPHARGESVDTLGRIWGPHFLIGPIVGCWDAGVPHVTQPGDLHCEVTAVMREKLSVWPSAGPSCLSDGCRRCGVGVLSTAVWTSDSQPGRSAARPFMVDTHSSSSEPL